jgi:hypothetical protein
MKKLVKYLLIKISRVIYYITPRGVEYSALEKKIKDNLTNETYNSFKEHLKKSLLFVDKYKIREYAIKTSLLNDKNSQYYYLEFGVWKGASANFFSNYVKKFYAFDSFEGLKEDWDGSPFEKGFFNLNKKIPKLNSNVEPTVGWVEDTLDFFLKKHTPKINFIHLDMDLYSPTKFVLEKVKSYLVKDAIIIFDQLYNYTGWEHGEYKALKEVFKEDMFQYKAFNSRSKQVVISIK